MPLTGEGLNFKAFSEQKHFTPFFHTNEVIILYPLLSSGNKTKKAGRQYLNFWGIRSEGKAASQLPSTLQSSIICSRKKLFLFFESTNETETNLRKSITPGITTNVSIWR